MIEDDDKSGEKLTPEFREQLKVGIANVNDTLRDATQECWRSGDIDGSDECKRYLETAIAEADGIEKARLSNLLSIANGFEVPKDGRYSNSIIESSAELSYHLYVQRMPVDMAQVLRSCWDIHGDVGALDTLDLAGYRLTEWQRKARGLPRDKKTQAINIQALMFFIAVECEEYELAARIVRIDDQRPKAGKARENKVKETKNYLDVRECKSQNNYFVALANRFGGDRSKYRKFHGKGFDIASRMLEKLEPKYRKESKKLQTEFFLGVFGSK